MPNEVLTPSAYEKVMDTSLSPDERLSAFASRQDWDGTLGAGTYIAQINTFANNIDIVAIVDVLPGPTDGINLPPVMQVADREAAPQAKARAGSLGASAGSGDEGIDWSTIDKVRGNRRRPRG